jgi:hypothetical protein
MGDVSQNGRSADVRCKQPQHCPTPPPPPPVDCRGSWSGCASNCIRTWRTSTYPVGSGTRCPTHDPNPACKYGEGACAPPRVDCDGSWSSCASSCTRSWTQTKAPVSGGKSCPTYDPNPECEPGDGACAVDCGAYGKVSSDGRSCECDADYYSIRSPPASSSRRRSSGPSRVEQVSKAACAIHCQSSVHCGEHGRCDGATMANLTSATYDDSSGKSAVVCSCDDGWGVLSYVVLVSNSASQNGHRMATPDCTKRDEECADGAAAAATFTVIATVLLFLPICCCGCFREPADDAARAMARPLLNSWDGVLYSPSAISSRRNWTRPCVLLLPTTAGFTIASMIHLATNPGYTWENCEVEAAMTTILCVVVVTAAGSYMISRSPTGCLPPKQTGGLRESLAINRAESFMNARDLGASSASAAASAVQHQPIASDVTADGCYTHVVNDDPEGRPVAYRRTPRMDDRTRFSATPGTRLRVVSAVPEWVQCSNQLWLVSKHPPYNHSFCLLVLVLCSTVSD